MRVSNLSETLNLLKYPGRGIVIGLTPDGTHGVVAYFIMGRSENSRNRVFVAQEDGLRTQAYDQTKMIDPSLIIYSPVKVLSDYTIVTNGDQTDTVYNSLKEGKTFEDALNSRTFEPDEPNYTPRISGILQHDGNNSYYKLSILKSNNGNPNSTQRFYFNYDNPIPGQGHLIHTYQNEGSPLPSFEGEPRLVAIENNIEEFTHKLWKSLNEDNKVSLFVRYINLTNGAFETKILNKNV